VAGVGGVNRVSGVPCAGSGDTVGAVGGALGGYTQVRQVRQVWRRAGEPVGPSGNPGG